MHVIAMENVSKHYTLSSGIVTPVLKGISLKIGTGEFVAIMGPSGSGKSTLLNVLGTLDRPSEGQYLLDGEDTGACDDAALAHIRNRTIGFVFQGFNLLPRRTVIDNIALPLLYGGQTPAARIERAEYHLGQVGLSSHRNYYPDQLSGGQQQRIAIARALAGKPEIILADEPTGNLDSHASQEIMEIFRTLNRDGITVVIVTHEQDVARHCKRLVQIKDGELAYDGPVS